MSSATTATASATNHLLTPSQGDNNSKIVSNGELINKIKAEDLAVTSVPALALGPQVSLKEQNNMDKDDKSLKWKEQLLGSTDDSAVDGDISKEAEVKILNLKIESPGRPDIVATTPYRASSAKAPLFTLKEGCLQQAKFEFVVTKNIVSGLKYLCEVWKKGIKVDSAKKKVGTFEPREEPYVFELDQSRIPTGFFVRGNYCARTRFVDDDGKCHFEETYYFDMQKNWGTQS